jgi:hypothetical protein
MLSLFTTATVAAQEAVPTATVTVEADAVLVRPHIDGVGYTFTVSGPDDFYLEREYKSGASFTLDATGLRDGVYKYEIRAILSESPTSSDEAQRGLVPVAKAPVQSGSFSVLEGRFVAQGVTEQNVGEQTGGSSGTDGNVINDQVILDDLIVDGSICVGFDCVNGESFGFDTLRLKENNLRIHFQDTSTSASFPTNDWRISINDSANGGADYFAVQDVDAGQNVFVIEASAGSNALYVDDYGRVGLGTSTPAVELEVRDGDTPTVRLNQDGSSGWSAQTWDLAGNEANFFIRDVTNGSQLPFRIQPGADSNALTIKSNNDVGIGTWTPEGSLHIARTGSNPKLVFERTDDHATMWAFNNASNGLRLSANGTQQFLLTTGGEMTIEGEMNAVAFNPTSDVNLKEGFAAVNGRDVLALLADIPITTWNFKSQGQDVRHIGPMAQDFYAAYGVGQDNLHISTTDADGVALAAIQALNEIVGEKEAQISALEARLTALEQTKSEPSLLTVLPWLLSAVLLAVLVGLVGKRFYTRTV